MNMTVPAFNHFLVVRTELRVRSAVLREMLMANPADMSRLYFEELIDMPSNLWEERASTRNRRPGGSSVSKTCALLHLITLPFFVPD